MPEIRSVPLANLQLDYENPRLEAIQSSHPETMHAVMRSQGDKLVAMAAHIVEYGLSPIERTLVIQAADDEKIYVVLEGNRRIMTLRLLTNPELATGYMKPSEINRLKDLHDAFQKRPIEVLEVVVAADREEADPWLQLRHRGQQGGAGLVEWGAMEGQRYNERRGTKSVELQIIDFVAAEGKLDKETKKNIGRVPVTNLRRLLSTPAVRERLGLAIDRKNHKVDMRYPKEEVLKGLVRIMRDLASGEVRVGDIYTEADRLAYLRTFRAGELPNRATSLAAPIAIPESPAPTTSSTPATRRASRSVKERVFLAPKSPPLSVSAARVRRIYTEAMQLRPDTFPNACAVIFRVFLELSIDHYISTHRIAVKSKRPQPSLADKATAVAASLETRHIMTHHQLKALRQAISNKNLAMSIESMNGYVHNPALNPKPGDLIPAWDDLHPIFAKIWA